jgi:hypothetical protein
MATVPDELLHTIATRVAQQVLRPSASSEAWPASYVLLVLSGGGAALDGTIARLAGHRGAIVGVADCPSAAAGALAAARARIPSMTVLAEEPTDVEVLVARADRVLAPAMDLALASRVAALHGETPGSRILLRALLGGTPVEVTLDDRDFRVSDRAPEGARRAVEQVEARLRALGFSVADSAPRAAEARASAPAAPVQNDPDTIRPHPSQDRFELPKSVNEFVDFLEHRGCTIEPGKPCIDCGACETRGF